MLTKGFEMIFRCVISYRINWRQERKLTTWVLLLKTTKNQWNLHALQPEQALASVNNAIGRKQDQLNAR